jgi:hypothetical protein
MDLSYFQPHKFENKVSFISHNYRDCLVLISPEAFAKIAHYVKIADEEVGWFGTVERYGNVFVIQDTMLFNQEVSSSTTEICEDDLGNFVTELMDTAEGMAFYEKMKYWGHSHHNMGTGPSGQDEQQALKFGGKGGHDWFLRGIHNKKGRCEFSLFLFDKNVRIDDLPWRIYFTEQNELKKQIEEEFKTKVKKKTFSRIGITHPNHHTYIHGKHQNSNQLGKGNEKSTTDLEAMEARILGDGHLPTKGSGTKTWWNTKINQKGAL